MHYLKNDKKGSSIIGFSLLETTIALALISTVLLSLLSFFPSLLKINLSSQNSAQAVFIAQSIFSLLEANNSEGILLTASDGLTNPQHRLCFSLEKEISYDIAYNKEGEPIRALTRKTAEEPLKENSISLIAHFSIHREHLLPNIIHLELSLSSPANIRESKRSSIFFHKLIMTKAS